MYFENCWVQYPYSQIQMTALFSTFNADPGSGCNINPPTLLLNPKLALLGGKKEDC